VQGLCGMNLTIYEFSPADGITPLRHTGLPSGTVLYPTSNPNARIPGWRILTTEEMDKYRKGIAWRDPSKV